jgi:sulfur carrier protein
MKVQINGKNEVIEEGASVAKILEKKGINPNVVACELNLKILRRAQLSEIYLKEGDELEIIQMVGGG